MLMGSAETTFTSHDSSSVHSTCVPGKATLPIWCFDTQNGYLQAATWMTNLEVSIVKVDIFIFDPFRTECVSSSQNFQERWTVSSHCVPSWDATWRSNAQGCWSSPTLKWQESCISVISWDEPLVVISLPLQTYICTWQWRIFEQLWVTQPS